VSLALIYAIVAIGLGLLIGHTGQISLGHAGFFAIGAYASALLTLRLGLPFVAALLVAGTLTATIRFLLGLPALRLSVPYLAAVRPSPAPRARAPLEPWVWISCATRPPRSRSARCMRGSRGASTRISSTASAPRTSPCSCRSIS